MNYLYVLIDNSFISFFMKNTQYLSNGICIKSLWFPFITCSSPSLASPSANPTNSSSQHIWEFMGDEGIWTEYQKPVSSSIYSICNQTTVLSHPNPLTLSNDIFIDQLDVKPNSSLDFLCLYRDVHWIARKSRGCISSTRSAKFHSLPEDSLTRFTSVVRYNKTLWQNPQK